MPAAPEALPATYCPTEAWPLAWKRKKTIKFRRFQTKVKSYLGSLQELGLSGSNVAIVSAPSGQDRRLQSAPVAESQSPRLLPAVLVNSVEINRRLLLGLPARQERDSGYGSGYVTLQSGDRCMRDVSGRVLGRARLPGGDHVRFQQRSLQENVMVGQRLVDERENRLGDLLGAVQVVIAVGEDLGLDDRDDAVHLADRGVTGEDVGVFEDRLVRWGVLFDFKHAAPLGEVAAVLFVLGAAFV